MAEIDTMLNVMFKSANLAIETTNVALNVLSCILPKENLNPEQTAWNTAIKNGDVDVTTCKNKDNKEKLIAQLEENDIMYKYYNDMVFTFANDRDAVNDICKDFIQESTINEVIGEINNKSFIELEVTTEDEMANFMNRLDKNNIDYTAITAVGNDDKHKIIMSDSDFDVLNRIKIDVAIDKADEKYNNIIKKINDKENEYRLNMLNKIGLKEKDSFIIADSDGTTIQANSKFMTLSNDNINKRILNTRVNDYDKVMKSFCEMRCPTLLTKEQLDNFNKADNKLDFLIDCRRQQGVGILSTEETEIIMKHEKEREQITQKLMQEHPEEKIVAVDDYNCQQSFFHFKAGEIDNYEFNHDKTESLYMDANFLNDAYMEYVGYDIIESEVDYGELSKIEEMIFNEEKINERLNELGINNEEMNNEIKDDIDKETETNEDFEIDE